MWCNITGSEFFLCVACATLEDRGNRRSVTVMLLSDMVMPVRLSSKSLLSSIKLINKYLCFALVEWSWTQKTEVFGKIQCQCHFIDHKSHTVYNGIECAPQTNFDENEIRHLWWNILSLMGGNDLLMEIVQQTNKYDTCRSEIVIYKWYRRFLLRQLWKIEFRCTVTLAENV